MGELAKADQLREASVQLVEPAKQSKKGNNAGSALLSGAAAALQLLGPLALKALMPMAL